MGHGLFNRSGKRVAYLDGLERIIEEVKRRKEKFPILFSWLESGGGEVTRSLLADVVSLNINYRNYGDEVTYIFLKVLRHRKFVTIRQERR